MDVAAAGAKMVISHDPPLQLNVGFDAVDRQLVQGMFHPRNGLIPAIADDDQFANHRVVVRRDAVARVDMRFPAYTKATGA